MTIRVSITESKEATFICPECGQLKTADVRKFVYSNRKIKINCKCSCGHKWTSVLERRKHLRKMVNLPGTCDFTRGDRVFQGRLKVMDLSIGGMRFKLGIDRKPLVGESLNLEFHLDDKNRTLVKTGAKVRSVKGEYIGTKFGTSVGIGPELGFYLMN
ncbi:MAG: hypothetical protein DRH90_17805 [Deltaproteobacteria bacterium]|nr:MAG: hypothetical protein DRH90_17805 [Deltaproteobacteria bacterium]RLC15101.1 MAG: hypothetical protein DRI24_11765 [Deltaproteobacteria bacterium]